MVRGQAIQIAYNEYYTVKNNPDFIGCVNGHLVDIDEKYIYLVNSALGLMKLNRLVIIGMSVVEFDYLNGKNFEELARSKKITEIKVYQLPK